MAPTSMALIDHFAPALCHRDAAQQTVETLYTMMEQDFTYSCCDYLYDDDDSNGDIPDEYTATITCKVTSDDRAKIVDWCYSVIDLCQFDRDNVAMAMSIVDRFMSNPCRLSSGGGNPPHFSHQEIMYDRSIYQLLAVSALYITIKINERVIFSSEELAAASRGIYSKEDIEAMERTILDCLSWRVCAPTAFQVGCVILELMIPQVEEANVTVVEVGRRVAIREDLAFQTENNVRDYQLATTLRPSTVAFMAIMKAIEVDKNKNTVEHSLLLKALVNILVEVKSLTTEE